MESCGYNRRVRVTDRVSVMGDKLGELLFERARSFLADISIPDFLKGPEGCPESMLRGLWQPVGLNPCFRACRYSPGGFFAPHHDAGFEPSDLNRSIKTFMIYLNDDFEGGSTNFYNANQSRYKTGLPKNRIFSLQPEKGSCLVFNHCITHDGGELTSGQKHILRTEVMYRHRSCFDERRAQGGEDSDSSFLDEGPGVDESLM
jgi:prolyl 4-hydroxylase